jgi:hypothetical protein
VATWDIGIAWKGGVVISLNLPPAAFLFKSQCPWRPESECND